MMYQYDWAMDMFVVWNMFVPIIIIPMDMSISTGISLRFGTATHQEGELSGEKAS